MALWLWYIIIELPPHYNKQPVPSKAWLLSPTKVKGPSKGGSKVRKPKKREDADNQKNGH